MGAIIAKLGQEMDKQQGGRKSFWTTCVSCKAIRDMSNAPEFMKGWLPKQLLHRKYNVFGLEFRQSPIQVLS